MNALEEHTVTCPYCAERNEILLDTSLGVQEFIEDCQVCCRPINFRVEIVNGEELVLHCWHENEVY